MLDILNGLKRLILLNGKEKIHYKYKESHHFKFLQKRRKTENKENRRFLGETNPQTSIEYMGSKGTKSVARGRKRGKKKPRSTKTKREEF